MPTINYQGTKLSTQQKQELIQKITEVASEITNTPKQFFGVIIQEFEEDSLGSGGKTVAQIKAELKK
ncbi:4-oxalocrotonate tautomerase family protein [Puteibacter caeruleilacunae]|nr:4-oxalocrotonate tautomerase family protein [Puteibacter caeruleilacunae]